MNSNQSHPARTVSPLNVAVYVFAGSQILSIPLPHAVLAAAAIGGGYALYLRLPEPIREKARSQYDSVKSILRERFDAAADKVRQTSQRTRIRVQRIVSNGVLVILIIAAFAGETFRNFAETIRLCAQVCAGEQPGPGFAPLAAA